MKFSIYNTILSITSQTLALYNAKSDKCMLIPLDMKGILSLLPSEIEAYNPQLYTDLVNINAIVPLKYDELDDVIKLSKQIDNDDSTFTLIINPTMSCNFKCWYCYETHILGSKISDYVLEKIYKLIDNILISNKNLRVFTLSFFGGEPLMYYNKTTRKIINYTRSKYDYYREINFSINFTSNAYLLNDDILSHLNEGGESNHFQITLDGGRDEHNKVRDSGKKEGSYDKIVEAIKSLLQNKIHVLLRINYTAENIESTKEIYNDLITIPDDDRQYLNIGYFRIWQDDKSIDLTNDILEIYSKYENENFNVSQDTKIVDELKHSCYADKVNELVINFNGDIYKCTARDFNQENKYGTLNDDGKIDWIETKANEWETLKIQSRSCHSCKILPLCGGGCHQVNLENKGLDTCQMGYSDEDKDNIILMRLSEYFINEEV
jgi:uncharacterized protein